MKDSVTSEEVVRLASGAGITLTEERTRAVREHLNNKLAGFAVLRSVDVTGVSPDFGGREALKEL